MANRHLIESITDETTGTTYRTYFETNMDARFVVKSMTSDNEGQEEFLGRFFCLPDASACVMKHMDYKTFAVITYPLGFRDGEADELPTIDLIHAKDLEQASISARKANFDEFTSAYDFEGLHVVEIRKQSTI